MDDHPNLEVAITNRVLRGVTRLNKFKISDICEAEMRGDLSGGKI